MKKTIGLLLATAVMSYADVEDDIFKSGVERTLEVMEYQKKLSLETTNYDNMQCYYMSAPNGDMALSNFLIIKLSALSLIAETKPLYYKDNKNKKHLCFFIAKSDEVYKANKNLIETKFDDIDAYNPKKVILHTTNGVYPVLPKLGDWHTDMSGTIEALNKEISSLKKKVASKNKSLRHLKKTIKTIVETVNDFSKQSAENLKEEVFKTSHVSYAKPLEKTSITKLKNKSKEKSKEKSKVSHVSTPKVRHCD